MRQIPKWSGKLWLIVFIFVFVTYLFKGFGLYDDGFLVQCMLVITALLGIVWLVWIILEFIDEIQVNQKFEKFLKDYKSEDKLPIIKKKRKWSKKSRR